MPKVRKIHVRPQDSSVFQQGESDTTTGLRVAAYARVSTEQESQSNSFQAQKDYYEKLIATTPGWIYAGIYADRGISGTSTDHREGFQAMMDDCRAGKVDRIITKSVSRFARNTVDSLNAIRELKALGIGIEFEKEGIFTLDSETYPNIRISFGECDSALRGWAQRLALFRHSCRCRSHSYRLYSDGNSQGQQPAAGGLH